MFVVAGCSSRNLTSGDAGVSDVSFGTDSTLADDASPIDAHADAGPTTDARPSVDGGPELRDAEAIADVGQPRDTGLEDAGNDDVGRDAHSADIALPDAMPLDSGIYPIGRSCQSTDCGLPSGLCNFIGPAVDTVRRTADMIMQDRSASHQSPVPQGPIVQRAGATGATPPARRTSIVGADTHVPTSMTTALLFVFHPPRSTTAALKMSDHEFPSRETTRLANKTLKYRRMGA